MKRLLILLFSIIVLITAAVIPADEIKTDSSEMQQSSVEIFRHIAADAPGSADLPLSDAVVLLVEHNISIDFKGNMTERFHRIAKLFNDIGMRRYSDPRIEYIPDSEKLLVRAARTIMPAGTLVTSPPNAFNIVTPREVYRYPDFLNIQQMVVTHTGLEPDSVVELDYSIDSVIPSNLFSKIIAIRDIHPIKKYILTLELNDARKLKVFHTKCAGEPEIKKETGKTIYTWTFSDLDGAPHESEAPDWNTIAERIFITNAGSWSELKDKLDDSFEKALSSGLKKMDKSANEEKKKSALEKFIEIAGYIHDSYSIVNVHPRRLNWKMRPIGKIEASGYGTELELIALLAAKCKDIDNLEVNPIFAMPGDLLYRDIPSIEQFSNIYALVTAGDKKYVYCPDTNKFIVLKNAAVLVTGNGKDEVEIVNIPADLPGNAFELNARYNIDEKGAAKVEAEATLKGNYFDMLGFIADEKYPESVFKKIFPGIKDLKVVEKKADGYSLKIKGEGVIEDIIKGSGEIKRMVFDAVPGSAFKKDIEIGNEWRFWPVLSDGPCTERYIFDIIVPENMKPLVAQDELKVENETGIISRSIGINEGSIRFSLEAGLKKNMISSDKWNELKEIMLKWMDEKTWTLYFTETKKK